MSSKIALAATITFIIFLLRLDHKQNPNASFALWLPTFWILLVTSKALGVWTGTGGVSDEAGSPVDKIVLSILAVIGLLILQKRNFDWAKFFSDNFWLIIITTYMLASILWSELGFVLFKRWIRGEAVMIIMACVVAAELNPRQSLMSVFRRIAYIHMPLSICLIKYYPLLGVQYGRWSGEVSWIGVSTQKNGLANICAFSIFYLCWTFIRKIRKLEKPVAWYQIYLELLLIMFALWSFMGPSHSLTYSSTSTFTLTIAIATFLIFLYLKRINSNLGFKFVPFIILFIIIYGIATPFIGGLSLFDFSSLLQRDSTLTGRSGIWEKIIPIAMNKPFLGHGFCYWTPALDFLTKANSSHNGYLDTILSLGFIGLILMSIFLLSTSHKAKLEMTKDFEWGAFWVCLILMATLRDITEASLDTFTGCYPMLIFITITLNYSNVRSFSSS